MGNICGNHQNVIVRINSSDSAGKTVQMKNVTTSVAVSHGDNESELWKIWEQLYKSRELEIKTQWQRSAFLATFIVLLLTGTGIFVFQTEFKYANLNIGLNIYVIGFFLGLLTMMSAVFWLALTKGSKYWTEIYEKKISVIEEKISFFNANQQFKYYVEREVKDNILRESDPLLVTCDEFKLDADHTSPSKVNVAIGWFLLTTGILLCIYYICGFFFLYTEIFFSYRPLFLCTEIFSFYILLSCLILLSPLILFVLLKYLYKTLKHKVPTKCE